MPNLILNATNDVVSEAIDATGPILVTVTGTIPIGLVKITANIGGGETLVYTYGIGDPSSLSRLEFTTGVSFKAYLSGTNAHPDTNVTVSYIFIN